ncbi:MAG: N-acetylneuraminate synthase family protein [Planctomycetes bacterium]|nr:N-acetylneuraminate synthase family protein [Planctomycetota bacterium]
MQVLAKSLSPKVWHGFVTRAFHRLKTGATRVNGIGSKPSTVLSEVILGGHSVGPGHRTLVVAEAGVNHNGRLDTALTMVDAASEAGADAVKFQMFRAADLATSSAPMASYQRQGTRLRSQKAMLAELELTITDFTYIKQHCDARGIVFLATPFGLKELAELQELNVPAVKIASTDLANGPLLKAAAETSLPLIVSTGASTVEEIHECVRQLKRRGAMERLILLHCVSCYPAAVEALNLGAIQTLHRTFQVPTGLSDHTTSAHVGGWAVAAGACVVEKHFTLDRSQDGPDHAMSLSPAELKDYITQIRAAGSAMGLGRLGMTELEEEVRVAAGRSVVAASDIPAGTCLTADLLTLKRPGTGISPLALSDLVGRKTRLDIAGDTVLTWEMIQ